MNTESLEMEAFAQIYFNMIKECKVKCLTHAGTALDEYENGCTNTCVKKYFKVHKFVGDVIQSNQPQ
ncbi:mitochondrial import inner membrane translocase subunit Tim10 [Acrasis kona]|uniref:Mitochondrial import inner membrane translocase subunit n=1 Tax=Acrasis kona TaxID=1008807 RepID=A0AAW2YTM3_9EUKA